MRNQWRLLLQRCKPVSELQFKVQSSTTIPLSRNRTFNSLIPHSRTLPIHFQNPSFPRLFTSSSELAVEQSKGTDQSVITSTLIELYSDPVKTNEDVMLELKSKPDLASTDYVNELFKNRSSEPGAAKAFFDWVMSKESDNLSSNSCNRLLGMLGANGLVKEFWDLVDIMKKKGYGVKKGASVRAIAKFEDEGMKDEVQKLRDLFALGSIDASVEKVSSRVCKVIQQTPWGDGVETKLQEMGIVYSGDLVKMILENLGTDPNKAVIFFRWIEESGLYKHDEKTYNAIARELAREDYIDKFWRLIDEMRAAGFDLEKATYIRVLNQFVRKKMLNDAVDLYEFAMSGNIKPSDQDCPFLLRKIVTSNELDMDLFSKVLKIYKESGNTMKNSFLDTILKSLTSVGRYGKCNKILKSMEEVGFLPDENSLNCLLGERNREMSGCGCFYWNRVTDVAVPDIDSFSLPSPIPEWPPGHGFATGSINLGELEVREITKFEFIWGSDIKNRRKGVNFFKPVDIPDGYFCLGHYSQSDEKPLRGFLLVAREVKKTNSPALVDPTDYTLVWCPDDWTEDNNVHGHSHGHGYFWLPIAPEGYKALGFIVTNKPAKPNLNEIQCVREDLTTTCEPHCILLKKHSKIADSLFTVWKTRPCHRGMHEKSVPVGTFFSSCIWSHGEDLNIRCLKNLNDNINSMPNLDQIHALINHYGPTIYFHPDEIYLPSSVSWFFEKGVLLHKKGGSKGERIDPSGSSLPKGERNDGEYWIDLPKDETAKKIKKGDLKSAKVYVHVKPALGGSFTDIVMWIFCPFNGPGCIKIGIMNYPLTRVGQHVGDWEHVSLRVSNFTGELWNVYFSQHSGGVWVDASDLEFIEGNKPIVYSSRNGHANYPHPGEFLQGSANLRIGIRNSAARSNHALDSSKDYEIVAAEYLGDGVVNEPCWLQFMRKWGPTTVHDSRAEVSRILNRLPETLRCSAQNIFDKLPNELYGEDGPTGPKEKSSWFGDEKC